MKENPNLFLKVIAFTISILILMIGIIKIIDKNPDAISIINEGIKISQ